MLCNNIFFAHFVSLQICGDQSQRVFCAQMMSCAMRYDVGGGGGVDGAA